MQDRGEWSSCSGCLLPQGKSLHIHWVGLRAGHDSLEKKKVFAPDSNQYQIPQLSCSLVTILIVLFGDGAELCKTGNLLEFAVRSLFSNCNDSDWILMLA